MKIVEFLTNAIHTLEPESGTARLDAEILLADEIDQSRAWVLAHPEHIISPGSCIKLAKKIKRRAKHEPLAYIRGKVEFYGREFVVDANVLVPRPESEAMIDCLKKLSLLAGPVKIADVGSGSGALGITAALELKNVILDCIDIDLATFKVARTNAKKHHVEANFYHGDLLNAAPREYDVLLCNLPYVPDTHTINDAAMNEPKHAIFGGLNGLDLYQRLFKQLRRGKHGTPYVFTESLPFQHKELRNIAQKYGYVQSDESDFIQVFKSS